MFTGIVRGLLPIDSLEGKPNMLHFGIRFPKELLTGLQQGASVSIDGVCLTVAGFSDNRVFFDVIQETLNRTTLGLLKSGSLVNVERSARFGDEIGGHILSGHIFGTAEIADVNVFKNNKVVTFRSDPTWMKYFFPKGYIALDGVSLTLVDVDLQGRFTVHLIPETLRLTTFGFKKTGDLVNVEIDSQTQTIVDTVERITQPQRGAVRNFAGLFAV